MTSFRSQERCDLSIWNSGSFELLAPEDRDVTTGPQARALLETSGFSKEVLEWPRALLSLFYELHTHRDAWPPTPVAEPTSFAPQQETVGEQKIPAISRAPRKRQGGGKAGVCMVVRLCSS